MMTLRNSPQRHFELFLNPKEISKRLIGGKMSKEEKLHEKNHSSKNERNTAALFEAMNSKCVA